MRLISSYSNYLFNLFCIFCTHSDTGVRYSVSSVVSIAISNSFFFSSRRRHTRLQGDWSSDVCSSDLKQIVSALDAAGFTHLVWIPDTHLGTWEAALGESKLKLIRVCREGEAIGVAIGLRSEERRVGKECRLRWRRGVKKTRERSLGRG